MTTWRQLSSRAITNGLLVGVAVVDVLAIYTQHMQLWPLQVMLFVLISFIPGVALLRLLGARFTVWLANLVASFALGVLMLMLTSLAANQFLPLMGVARPLEFVGVFGAWQLGTLSLIVAASFRNLAPLQLRFQPMAARSWLFVVATAALPGMAVLGAFRLNNGGDGLAALITLGYAAVLVVWVIAGRRRLPDAALAWFVFVLGLAVLLMTSFRGWDITGHDVVREFRVYNLTHTAARWNVASFRDAYNACLSITILPQAYNVFLQVSGILVFKLLLQVIFAACPVVVFLLLRHYLSKLGALTGCLFFISYSTFVNDAAMLTRQGVAYLFFALALFVVLDWRQTKAHKLLFLICSLGVILSHYSTTYLFVALFTMAVACKWVIRWWSGKKGRPTMMDTTVMTPLFALILAGAAFTWSGLITQTAGGLAATVKTSITNIPHLMSDENKSSDTSAALLFAAAKSPVDTYQSYVTDVKRSTQAVASQDMPQLTDDDMPLTAFGHGLSRLGLESTGIETARQVVARFLQLLAVGGVVFITYLLWRQKSIGPSLDYVCMCWSGLIMLTFIVVLPTFSLNYGILRAFHQTMIFLLLPMMLVLARSSQWLRPRIRTGAAVAAMTGLFLLFTGAVAQLVGGTSATLSLNNRGLYYGLYYTTAADLRGYDWLKAHIAPRHDVRASSFAPAVMYDSDYPFSTTEILPSQIHDNSYVLLTEAQTLRQKLFLHYDGSSLITTFPLGYYLEQKNKLYSTIGTGVYR